MKRSGRCPKCDGPVIYVAQVADEDEGGLRAMKLVRHVKRDRVLGVAVDVAEPVGELEAGVCRVCGYTELYVKNPEEIPLDGRTAWIIERKDPYR